MRCSWVSMACELNVGSRPRSPKSSRWLSTVMPRVVGVQPRRDLVVGDQVDVPTQSAYMSSERSEYFSSSRDWKRLLLAAVAWSGPRPAAIRACDLRSSQAGSLPSTHV